MKSLSKLTIAAACSICTSAIASVSISFSGGVLSNSSGTELPDGALVYAVSSASNVFPTGTNALTSLSVGDFTFGDNVLLGSWSVDSGVAGPGTFEAFLGGINLSGGIAQGNRIAIIWVPGLSAASINTPSALVSGMSYGVYADPSWVVPADGSTVGYAVETVAIGGAISNSLTVASQSVGGSAIPEPSSFAALAGLAMLGFAGMRKRRSA